LETGSDGPGLPENPLEGGPAAGGGMEFAAINFLSVLFRVLLIFCVSGLLGLKQPNPPPPFSPFHSPPALSMGGRHKFATS